jgi:hypothetical protein
MLMLVNDLPLQQTRRPPPALRSRTQLRRGDYNRRRFLAWLRDEIAILRAIGLEYCRIAALLDIEEHDVRAFCPKPNEKTLHRNLPRRAAKTLLHGRHAAIGGRSLAKRSRHLVEIAAAYTWNELLSEPGVGTVTANKIRLWLEERGASLRLPE